MQELGGLGPIVQIVATESRALRNRVDTWACGTGSLYTMGESDMNAFHGLERFSTRGWSPDDPSPDGHRSRGTRAMEYGR